MAEVKGMTFSPFEENTYIVHEQSEAIIIDPGCFDANESEQLKGYLTQNGLTPTRLINTHCHLDHIYGNAYVKNTYNLDLEIHPEEAPVLSAADSLAAAFGAPPTGSPAADRYLREGDKVRVGNTELQVLLTPGHSPGHISLLDQEGGYILSADVLFQGGIGRTDLPGADYDTLIKTIKEQLLPLGDHFVVYPGHGPATTIGDERWHNPFLQGSI